MKTNTFVFSEQAASHGNVITIRRVNGQHTYHSRWAALFAKLAGNRNHYFLFG